MFNFILIFIYFCCILLRKIIHGERELKAKEWSFGGYTWDQHGLNTTSTSFQHFINTTVSLHLWKKNSRTQYPFSTTSTPLRHYFNTTSTLTCPKPTQIQNHSKLTPFKHHINTIATPHLPHINTPMSQNLPFRHHFDTILAPRCHSLCSDLVLDRMSHHFHIGSPHHWHHRHTTLASWCHSICPHWF